MKHVLGNLLSSDYDSLFSGEEFLKITEGLKNSFSDILCRYYDTSDDITLFAKVCNKIIRNINDIHKPKDLQRILKKI